MKLEANREKMRQALHSGRFSGRDAARMIVLDNVEVDHGRDALLTARERRNIKNSLRAPEDIVEYNGLVETYRIVAFTSMQAEAEAGRITCELLRLKKFVNDWRLWLIVESLGSPVNAEIKRSITFGLSDYYEFGQDGKRDALFESYANQLRSVKTMMRTWLPYELILRDVSRYMEIDLDEDVKRLFDSIKAETHDYNHLVGLCGKGSKQASFPLKAIEFDQLTPLHSIKVYLAERFAMTLGDNWQKLADKSTNSNKRSSSKRPVVSARRTLYEF